MSDLTYRSFLLSGKEFMVLSAMAGMTDVRLPAGEQPELPDRKELSLIVFQLCQKGFLDWENDTCALVPEIRTLFRDIRYADKELQIFGRTESVPLMCFWNECPVLAEYSENDRDRIRVHGVQKNEFFAELCDRGILPEERSQERLQVRSQEYSQDHLQRTGGGMEEDSQEVWERFLAECPELVRDGKVQYGDLRTLFEKQDMLTAAITVYDRAAGREQSVILILECGLFDGLALADGETVRVEDYTLEGLRQLW